MKFDIRSVGIFDVVSAKLADGEVFDSAELKSTVRSFIESDMRDLVIDLGTLEYLYSDTINSFIACNRYMLEVGGRIGVLTSQEKVQDILKRAGLENIMRIYHSEAEVIEASETYFREIARNRSKEKQSAAAGDSPEKEPQNPIDTGFSHIKTVELPFPTRPIGEIQSSKPQSNTLEQDKKVSAIPKSRSKIGNRNPLKKRLCAFLANHKSGESVSAKYLLSEIGCSEDDWNFHYSISRLPDLLSVVDNGFYKLLVAGFQAHENLVFDAIQPVRKGEVYHRVGDVLEAAKFNYRLEAHLGSGYSGKVWKATNIKSNKAVALKMFSPNKRLLTNNTLANLIRRFAREGSQSMFVNHENIVEYLDFSLSAEPFFSVMELADESLSDYLDRRTKVSMKESINIVRQCLRGLRFLHERKCWHRDIKPQNILIKGGRFLLGDLGILKWKDPQNNNFVSLESLTIDGAILGTRNYMPIEQEEDPGRIDGSADIYALGISWYQMLTGKVLLPARVAANEFVDPEGSPEVTREIKAMLRFHSVHRPSAQDLLSNLEKL